MFSSERLKTRALELGFNLTGITRAEPSPTLDAYFRWIDAGMHGDMAYMARPDRQARRRDLNVILPGVRSLVVVGLDYRTEIPESTLTDPARGRFSAYAWGLDYHDLMTPRLETLAAELGADHRVYVDTGAILERSHAHGAGLGFTGKNTMLIHPRRGSFFFLGEILTTLEFDEYDQAGRATLCGTCTRCLRACPTNAFPRPHVLDARRCISYLTIEHKGWIEPDLRPLMGNWVYGCDVCQDVCPFNRFTSETCERVFRAADADRAAPPLLDLLALDDAGFQARFVGSAAARIKRERLVRNACIATGNWGSPEALPALTRLLEDASPLVRGHAAWALNRIPGGRARIAEHLTQETHEEVRAEIESLLR
ncbi:MAG: tRNA epoxyqueuosine(34) reductase QueG [Anaerolinea sp.]|nr:tRNA epoxyqueuosine(34) reductase QueG [Anaerolinea sp.]